MYVPPPPPLVRQAPQYYEPQLSYKDLLSIRQHEMREARHARQVAPMRSHYGL